jgi:predicted DNA-binding protein
LLHPIKINAKAQRREEIIGIAKSAKWCYHYAVQTLTLKVPDELADRLSRRARDLNRSKSEIIRQALAAQLDGTKKFESLLDRAGDLVGKYAGSKHSSHKRNLKGFGLKSLGSWKRS